MWIPRDNILVNMTEHFNLENLVTEQINVNIEDKADPNQIFKYSEQSKKMVNDACMNKLRMFGLCLRAYVCERLLCIKSYSTCFLFACLY